MVSQNVAEIIKNHVVLEVECIDRMYLNGYVPGLQTEGGFVHFVRQHLGFPIASTAVISPLSKAFVHAIEVFAKEQQVDLIPFGKNQRKDDVTQEYLTRASFTEGVLYIGKAQEKAAVFRTIHKRNAETGKSYPWISRGTALPNITTSTCWTKTSGRCLSNSVLTFLMQSRSASMVMNGLSVN